MSVRLLRAAAVTISFVLAAACSRSVSSASDPQIRLTVPDDGSLAYVEVVGLPTATLDLLRDAELAPEEWSRVLRVAVDDDAAGMLGAYSVRDGAVRFTPAFPFDAGRQYRVRFDPAQAEALGDGTALVIAASVGLPATHTVPSTLVTRVYPSGDVVPENLLRMYIEFSGPMGRPSGIPYLKLLDEHGDEITDAFLPLDYEFWSPDHTRFTAFFDPGRVKDGILPNQEMGRALTPERTVTLVVSRDWKDEHGLPLKEEYRRTYRVGPPQAKALDTASWRIQPPPAGGRDGLVVTFPAPLDHGLLMRALGVTREGAPIDGEILVDDAERRWTFRPSEPWRAGTYHLLALDILEDVAGNQIGRAFEVDNFDTVDKSPIPQSILLPFEIRD
jgi:hypothetical protein